MKRRDVVRALRRVGCSVAREGSEHTIWQCSCPEGPHRGVAETRGGVRRRSEIDTGAVRLPREGVAAMTDYRARAWREDPWWVVEVEGVGATQAKSVDKIDHMARALVADVEGVPYDEVGITVHIDLPAAVAQDVRTMKETSARAADLTREAARLQREVVQKLHVNEHLTGREIAAVLGVTPGRVSQLFKVSPTKSGPRATRRRGSARTRASGST